MAYEGSDVLAELNKDMAKSNREYADVWTRAEFGEAWVPPYLDSEDSIKKVFAGRGTRNNFFPMKVAIGPRFHGEKALEGGEKMKLAAAHEFCANSGRPVAELYGAVDRVASTVRGFYAKRAPEKSANDTPKPQDKQEMEFTKVLFIEGCNTPKPQDKQEREFTKMLFIDGCFVLQFTALITEAGSLTACPYLQGFDMVNNLGLDLLLIENQLPWLVLQELMKVRKVNIMRLIDEMITWFERKTRAPDSVGQSHELDYYKPQHLLDLFCKRQVGQAKTRLAAAPSPTYMEEFAVFTSTHELAEAGVFIVPSGTCRFSDIDFWAWPMLFGKLHLPTLNLSYFTIPLLLNMVALERSYGQLDRYDVCGYLYLLTQLVDGEDDVRRLRRKGVLNSVLSDKETLEFIKAVQPHAGFMGPRMQLLLARINGYYNERWWIPTYRFCFNNFRTLVTVGSFVSFGVSILKAILSLQQAPPATAGGGSHGV